MLQTISLLVGYICLLTTLIAATEESLILKKIDHEELNSPLLDASTAPSSIVGGAVNIITGNYFECHSDLTIPSAHPIALQRSFNSANSEKGNLCHGWDLNLPSKICFSGSSVYVDDRGTILSFEYNHNKANASLIVKSKQLRFGITNYSTGVLSSWTNIRNKKLLHKKNSSHCELHNESGETLFYKNLSEDSPDFKVRMIQFPNRCIFTYDYDKRDRLIRVSSKGQHGIELGHIEWKYPHKFADSPKLNLISSDSRQICFEYAKHYSHDRCKNHRYFLKNVIRNFAPKISYDYSYVKTSKIERLIKKSLPENRFLRIGYYEKGANRVRSENIHISHSDDSRVGRVSALYAPVGTDASPILTWSFKYYLHKDHHSRRPIGGKTEALDALGHRRMYHFSDQQRLTSIEHFLDSGQLYREEKMFWAESGREETFLLSQGLADGNGMLIVRRSFVYDDTGNVLQEDFRGNLTGLQSQPIPWNSFKQSENYSKTFTYTKNGLLQSEVDGRKQTFYHYLENTNLVAMKLISDNKGICERYHYSYDQNSTLIKEIVDDGNSPNFDNLSGVTERHIKKITPTTFQPIGLPKIIEEIAFDPSTGEEISLGRIENTYSKEGHLLHQETYDSHGVYRFCKQWNYDSFGNVLEEIDPLGQATTYKYDQNNNRIFQQSPNLEFYTTFTYDFANRLINQKNVYLDGQLEDVILYSYDYMGNRVASTDIYGNTTHYRFDEFGRLIEKTNPPIVDINGDLVCPIDKVVYDCMNHPTEITDANGNTTKTFYTARGKPYLIIYPDGSLESFIYDLDGTLIKSTAKNGSYSIYEHDYQQRCISKKVFSASDEFLFETSATYSAFHTLTEVDASGSITFYNYDSAGRKVKVRKNDAETIYIYDSLGREIECHERFGDGSEDFIVKAKQYDVLNRVIEETVQNLSGNTYQKVSYGYDVMNNRCEVCTFNENGMGIEKTRYDIKGRPTKATDALGNITRTHYDIPHYNLFSQLVACQETIDALGNCSITISDAMGNVAANIRKNSFGKVTQKHEFTYDQCCNKIRMDQTVFTPDADNRQVVTEWAYDSCNRIISLTEAKGTAETKCVRYTYNIAGEKKEIIKADGVVLTNDYDGFGRLALISSSDGSISYAYTYDSMNNPLRIDDNVHQISTIKVYDSNNRLIIEELGNQLKLRYKYDRLGRATLIELPDGTFQETCYSYPYMSEIRRLTSNGSCVYSHRYSKHDLSGNIVEAQLVGNAGKLTNNYDLLGRKTNIEAPHWNETLTYDAVGNVSKRDQVDKYGSLECHYSYDDLYQLKSESGAALHDYQYDSLHNRTVKDGKPSTLNALNQLLSDSEVNYFYDNNGNLTLQNPLSTISSAISCTYDAFDRLISVLTTEGKINYLYDSENRRLQKTGGSSAACQYFYIGCCEIGCCNMNGEVIEYRLLGQGKGAEIGAAVAMEIKGVLCIPLHDAQGNLVSLLDRNGEVVSAHRYSAFGEETTDVSSEISPWRISSKRYDSETGFIYFGRRYYSPQIGKWTTADPIGYEGGINLYCYVVNAPLTHFDLFGLFLFHRRCKSSSSEDKQRSAMLFTSLCPPTPITPNSTLIHSDLYLNNKDFFPQAAESFHVGNLTSEYRGMGYTNGMCTTRERAEECGQMLSKLSGGYRCDVVHNPSGGLANDVKRFCIASRSLYATNVIPELHKNWNDFFDTSGLNSLYLQNCHSEGVCNVRNALIDYDRERATRIHVVAVAPSVYIDRWLCGEVRHYRSDCDFVPLADSEGRKRNLETTHVLNRHSDAPYWDHDYTSPTYEFSIQYHINKHYRINGVK